ncbi:hypothetical protein T484DRAFT_1892038 [Baffinella frigidus]|nr:hypothetical protein T484DRAFT_1892038 [Cryptophyta sp. CCMP2293]
MLRIVPLLDTLERSIQEAENLISFLDREGPPAAFAVPSSFQPAIVKSANTRPPSQASSLTASTAPTRPVSRPVSASQRARPASCVVRPTSRPGFKVMRPRSAMPDLASDTLSTAAPQPRQRPASALGTMSHYAFREGPAPPERALSGNFDHDLLHTGEKVLGRC